LSNLIDNVSKAVNRYLNAIGLYRKTIFFY
jgi:hypothetical protein